MLERMNTVKEKIAAVRSVVSTYSNDEIVLVLQHHDYDIDLTINDFVEGQVSDILMEWKHAGSSKSNKAKKRKKKAQQKKQKQMESNNESSQKSDSDLNGYVTPSSVKPASIFTNEKSSNESNFTDTTSNCETSVALIPILTNGLESNHNIPIATNSISPTQSKDSNEVKSSSSCTMSQVEHTVEIAKRKQYQRSYNIHTNQRISPDNNTRHRAENRKKQISVNHFTSSEINGTHSRAVVSSQNDLRTTTTSTTSNNKKSIEKAVRDLQRCSVSFGRYRTLLNEEINASYKRIQQVFEELVSVLNDREVNLIRKLDAMKEEAFGLLAKREARAGELKKQTDRVDAMSQRQIAELRNDIKHFVAERKYDEELGRTTRFVYERDIVTKVIPFFGEISAVKNSYSNRPRPNERIDSVTSDTSALSTSSVPEDFVTSGNVNIDVFADPPSRNSLGAVECSLTATDWAEATDHHPLPDVSPCWMAEDQIASDNHHDKQGGGVNIRHSTHVDTHKSQRERPNRQKNGRYNGYHMGRNEQDDSTTTTNYRQKPQSQTSGSLSDSKEQRGDDQTLYKSTYRNNFWENSKDGCRRFRGGFRGRYRGGPRGVFRGGPNNRPRDSRGYPTRNFNNLRQQRSINKTETSTHSNIHGSRSDNESSDRKLYNDASNNNLHEGESRSNRPKHSNTEHSLHRFEEDSTGDLTISKLNQGKEGDGKD